MIEVSKANINLDNIEIDEHWNLGSNAEHKIHKIHTYPAKFPAFITQKALEYAFNEQIEINRIADIFCGCGTVAYEARRAGIDFWGCDINPVAALIARVKSKKLDSVELEDVFNSIIDLFNRNRNAFQVQEINPRISYWFDDSKIRDLSLLKYSIKESSKHDLNIEDFFVCAFSNILKATSRWLTKSIKPQIDPDKIPADVLSSFKTQFSFMLKANEESEAVSQSKVEIEIRNSLEIARTNSVDFIITSPPYVTSYEYADLHQLSLLWLDYATDYRDYRKNTIGSSYSSEERMPLELNEVGKEIVEPFKKIDNSKSKSITKYYLDMQKIANVSYDLLTENGAALFVIGNTEYKGVHINNAKHLALSLFESGFRKVCVTKRKISGKILSPYRDNQGRFTSNLMGKKVYSEEFIVVGRK